MIMSLLASFTVGLATLFLGIGWILSSRRSVISSEVEGKLFGDGEQNDKTMLLEDLIEPLRQTRLGKVLEKDLAHAEISAPFHIYILALLVLTALGFMIGTNIFHRPLLGIIFATIFPGILVFMVRQQKESKIKKFREHLPDMLRLIANGLSAGNSIQQAFELAAEEGDVVISDQLVIVVSELKLGISFENAMERLFSRVPIEEMRVVINAISIQYQVGGNLADVLRNIAEILMRRRLLSQEISNLTAEGVLSGIIIGLMPPVMALIMYLINPSYLLVLFINPVGRLMLFAAIVLETVGAVLLRKLSNIKV